MIIIWLSIPLKRVNSQEFFSQCTECIYILFVYLTLSSSTTRSKEIINPISLARHVSSHKHTLKCLKFNVRMLLTTLPKHSADTLDTLLRTLIVYISSKTQNDFYLFRQAVSVKILFNNIINISDSIYSKLPVSHF